MALHDPDLIKAHAANQNAIALANVSETALNNFRAMTVGERRHRHEAATMEAIRNDLLANRPCNHSLAPHYRLIAANARKTAAALKAIGL